MREGEKWYYEVSEFFGKYVDIDKINYCGFQWVTIENRYFNSGVFEFESSIRFTKEFINALSSYSSEHILCMSAHDTIGRYRNCVVVVLR